LDAVADPRAVDVMTEDRGGGGGRGQIELVGGDAVIADLGDGPRPRVDIQEVTGRRILRMLVLELVRIPGESEQPAGILAQGDVAYVSRSVADKRFQGPRERVGRKDLGSVLADRGVAAHEQRHVV